MPQQLALALTGVLAFWLFRRDMRLRELPSPVLWIPAVWLALGASRPVSLWLTAIGINAAGNSNLEGNLTDTVVFLGLMFGAVLVLNRRAFDWGAFVSLNKALIVIYAYLALSAFWSEYSLATLKRVAKDFGCVLVALVLLSEAHPLDAIRTVFVRVAYLLLPLSVAFIKYFPDLGRRASRGGDALFIGVSNHKNSLGLTVLVLGLFFVVDLWQMKKRPKGRQRLDEWIRYGMLAMGLWLLLTCDSRTSLVCLVLGCLLFWGTGYLLAMHNPRRMLFRCLALIACMAVLESAFNVSGIILEAIGRDRTLTGRTEIWDMVKEKHTNPLFGCGFYTFWSTGAGQDISESFKGTLATVHNGLLEMYVDGGAIGVGLLVLLLLTWGRRSILRMLEGTAFGRLAFTFWVLAVIYNFSETDYFRPEPLWFTLLAMMIEYPPLSQASPALTKMSLIHTACGEAFAGNDRKT
jgi:O-antigen ligase